MTVTAQQFSKRLGVLSSEQFQAALGHFGLGALVEAAPIPFGNWGQNVYLRSTTGEYVLRGAPHYDWQFQTERYFSQQLHERAGVPVAWPYQIDDSTRIFGWSYVIMPWMAGLQLIDPAVKARLAPAARQGIASAMGAMLARMHTPTWPQAGRYDPASGTIMPFEQSYGAHIISEVRRIVAEGYSLGTLAPADGTWVEAIIAAGRAAAEDLPAPGLVMGDYHEGNIVVECIDGTWRVSGVFDLMTAHVGDPEADLSRLLTIYQDQEPHLARPFLEAYWSASPPRPGFTERFPLYMVYDRLLMWAFAHDLKCVWWDKQLSFREWAGQYTAPPYH